VAAIRPRRLIEVDLPIRRISEQARREKSIRHGHLSTLHIWWARRPLAACRSVVLAGLLPDPDDDACPQQFRDQALRALNPVPGKMRPKDDRTGLRHALLDFIADFSDWDRSADPTYLKAARDLVAAAYPNGPPTVLDPFAGGGAIPLEALRVGADAWAGDLNPVAVLLEKVILEYVPRHGQRLADGVQKWGAWIKEQAQAQLAPFYPSDPDGNVPIAYLWARTALCEGPGCGARVPLIKGLRLSKKAGRTVAYRLDVHERNVTASIQRGVADSEVGAGTVKRGSLTCPVCRHTTPVASVRLQARTRGLPEMLLAVVTTTPGAQGRNYRVPTGADLAAAAEAKIELDRRKGIHRGQLSLVPDEQFPAHDSRAFTPGVYGIKTWGELFTPRQALALSTLAELVRTCRDRIAVDAGDAGLATAITTCLGLAVDRQADYTSSLCMYSEPFIAHTFGRHALPIVWDFAEVNPFSGSSGHWDGAIDWIVRVLTTEARAKSRAGSATQASATNLPVPDASQAMVCTDPPYYDAVPYSDLADFFYVWLRRSLLDVHPDLLSSPLTPKDDEIVVNLASAAGRDQKLRPFFESNMAKAFHEARRVLSDDGIAIVVFAHQETAAWEALLQALVTAGWTATGSWPIDTERPGRLRAQHSAALASSVHIVCRPRPSDAGVGDWSAILRELQPRVDSWMRRLSSEGVVGADAIFACLGPAIELYSRFDRVETAAGNAVPLGGRSESGDDFLSHVWAAVARAALRTIFEEAEATGFEADGRLAAVWLWTLGAGQHAANGETTDDEEDDEEDDEVGPKVKVGGFVLPYDTARKLAQPLGADLSELGSRPGAAFEVKGAIARMLSLSERRRYLFDSDGATAAPVKTRTPQASLFGEEVEAVKVGNIRPGPTTLDRVHQAMLLFGEDRGDALRRLLVEDGAGEDARFWRLADALSKLYPANGPEKRWVDGVLARKRMLNL